LLPRSAPPISGPSSYRKRKLYDTLDDVDRMRDLVQTIAYAQVYHQGSVRAGVIRRRNVRVHLGGACEGCPMAPATLRLVVERTSRPLPEVRASKRCDWTRGYNHGPYRSSIYKLLPQTMQECVTLRACFAMNGCQAQSCRPAIRREESKTQLDALRRRPSAW